MAHFDPRTLGRLWAQEAPSLAPSGAQAHALGWQKGYKTQWVLTIFCFEATQGGTKQEDQHEEQQEAPKRPMTRFDPPSLGPGASLGSPKGL